MNRVVNHRRVLGSLLLGATLGLAAPAMAQSEAEQQLLEQVRSGQTANRAESRRALEAFRSASDLRQRELLEQARARAAALQAESQELELLARNNKRAFDARILELRNQMGPNSAMFGSLQQIAADLIGIFRNSPTSLQYPDREAWLNALRQRMERASEIFSIEDLEQIWFLVQQEITASGQIVSLQTEILGESGSRETRDLVRVGKFVLVTNDPEPAYLTWQADSQRASMLKKQPDGEFLGQIDRYLDRGQGPQALGIDPTAGSLLSRLVDSPSFEDRIAQGGPIGYLILIVGAVGVIMAVLKLLSILFISAQVAAQRRDLGNPRASNPLGRMLKVYEDNKDQDTETLEMRLGEAILEERPKIDRYVGLIKVISAVAPLMGLMGTVIGMIATFQAITLFGTGDPKTMAGGISQALVTTVMGLSVAIPTVLLHAVVSARATAVINTLKHQTAGLIAERMEARLQGRGV